MASEARASVWRGGEAGCSGRPSGERVELLFERFQLEARFPELSLSGQALVIGEIAGGFSDQLVLIGRCGCSR